MRTQSSPSPRPLQKGPRTPPQTSDKVPSPWAICTDRDGDAFVNRKTKEGQEAVVFKVFLCFEKIPVI